MAQAILALMVSLGASASAATFTVTSSGDNGAGTLRQAITDANANTGSDTIHFDAAVTNIALLSSLPSVSETLIIDGSINAARVTLDGATSAVVGNGLTIINSAANCEIYGLEIHGFSVDGVNAAGPGLILGAPGKGNVIRATGGDSLELAAASSDALVQSNLMGLMPDGITLSACAAGIQMRGSNHTIGGDTPAERNVIAGPAASNAINLIGGTGHKVIGNYIGTDATGTLDFGASAHGIYCQANNCQLGGPNPGEGNLIAGNSLNGIHLFSLSSFLIQGNTIGLSSSGTTALANTNGIVVLDSNTGGTIRDNFISGNSQDGINCAGDNIQIHGNVIGLAIDASTVVANQNDGIDLGSAASGVVIGSSAPTDRNIVSGNGLSTSFHGIRVAGTSVTITNNYVGTDSTGLLDRGNTGRGVSITGTNTVLRGNVISGNGRNGVVGGATGFGVYGNIIGLGADGTTPLGNDLEGIDLDTGATGAIIGTTTPGDGNQIAHNGGYAGVSIDSNNSLVMGNTVRNNILGGVVVYPGRTGNKIQENSIYGNPGIAIGIDWFGPISNDALDADTGGNNWQNFPELAPVRPGDSALTGVLPSAASTTYRLDFYRNPGCAVIGWGDAREWIGTANVTTDASGRAPFTFTLPSAAVLGEAYTATATDPANNTSGISYCALVETDPQPDATAITRNAGSPTPSYGPTVDFDLTFDEPVSDLSAADFTILETGALTGSALTSFSYPMGNALSMGRTTAFTRATGNFDLSNRSFTVEFWSYRDVSAATVSDYPISYFASNTQLNHLHIGWRGGYNFTFGFNQNNLNTATEWNISNEWEHWACTFDNATLERKIYRNGVLMNSDIALGALQNPGTFTIGANSLGSYSGKLDEVRVWGVARTPAEIQAAMHTPATGAEANLLALYQFESLSDLGVNSDGTDDLADSAGAGSYPLDQTAGAATVVGSTVYSTTITATIAVGTGDGTLGLSTAGLGTGHDSNYFSLTAPGAASQTFAIDQTAPTVAITPVSPDPHPTGVSSMTFVFDSAVSGFTLSNLALTKDLSPVSLSSASLSSSDGGITWTLSGLAALNAADGAYELTLSTTGIVDGATNQLAAGATESWTVQANTAVRDWMFLQD